MRGAALVELALLLPMLLLLALGMAELGRALEARLALEGMSRAGAELAAAGALPLRESSDGLMETLAATASPELRANGAIVITRIADAGNGPIVLEQYRWDGGDARMTSALAQCDAASGCMLSDEAWRRLPPLSEGASVLAVEAHYRYAPLFSLFSGLAGEWCAITLL
ncbi:pilus assembly protein [Noviherbaspirillum sp. DKR-6]|uniref:Pilus assembly protein n=2 Tax=Noviherbaspirillum pedocola TaxID=2801341 RepID=A0A934SQL5_9BURK|nr:pilus assembly protein [Noviherbaspirillum pedocola]